MFATTILGVTLAAVWWFVLLAVWIAIAFWPARVADRKGHSFWGYFVFSLIFFPLALLVAYMVHDQSAETPSTSAHSTI